MSDLSEAIQELMEANPDPAAVRALAAETEKRRMEPYEVKGQFMGLANPNDRIKNGLVHCSICGAVVPWGFESVHIRFHNDIERRLRKMVSA